MLSIKIYTLCTIIWTKSSELGDTFLDRKKMATRYLQGTMLRRRGGGGHSCRWEQRISAFGEMDNNPFILNIQSDVPNKAEWLNRWNIYCAHLAAACFIRLFSIAICLSCSKTILILCSSQTAWLCVHFVLNTTTISAYCSFSFFSGLYYINCVSWRMCRCDLKSVTMVTSSITPG